MTSGMMFCTRFIAASPVVGVICCWIHIVAVMRIGVT